MRCEFGAPDGMRQWSRAMQRSTTDRPGWRPRETIDLTNESDVRQWAKRLCLTPAELREMVEDLGDSSARIATEFGLPLRRLVEIGGPTRS